MIQRAFITQWGTVVPWSSPRLVEQDLIICRALVSIYSDPFLKEHLAFRGGTALHKLYLELVFFNSAPGFAAYSPSICSHVFTRLSSCTDSETGRIFPFPSTKRLNTGI